jgi:WD40 repeat protein/serine/threonine protein kinase
VSAEHGIANCEVSQTSAEDAELARVLDECLEALEAGRSLDAEALAAAHPAIAERLRACLASLQVVERATGELAGAAPEGWRRDEAECLGDFRLLRQVGRGGMGVVYEAEQMSLRRRVAVKVLPLAAALDARQLQRFKNESLVAAQLHHTHIVPVYYVGCERGVHFYAMQYVEGHSLAAVVAGLREVDARKGVRGQPAASPLRAAPVDQAGGRVIATAAAETPRVAGTLSTARSTKEATWSRTVARQGVEAAEALDHAHQQGVVHRDVKPGNLLVDAAGHLWVTDFGLAQVQTDTRLTLTGDLVGTLRYMSPEQALAKRGIIDHRTDIYSLGATLYELLTLEPAFTGADRQELLRQIAFEEPQPPRRLNRALPAELETIVLKALEKNPDQRYATAQELADDLKHWLAGEPIRAQPVSRLEKLWRWCWRNPALTAAGVLAVVALVALVALAIGSTLTIQLLQEQERTRSALREADAQRARAEHQEKFARHYLYGAQMNLAQRAWESNHASLLLDFLERHRPRQAADPDLRGFEWYYLWRLSHAELFTLPGHTDRVYSVAFSPDGRRLASGSRDATVKVWDTRTERELLTIDKGLQGGVRSVHFSPDGRRLASANSDHTVRVWEVLTGQQLLPPFRGHTRGVISVHFSPDGRRLASASSDHTVRVWDALTGQELLKLEGHTGSVNGVAYSPDGKRLASASDDLSVKVWDSTNGQELFTLKGHASYVRAVTFSPDGKWVASASGDIKVWDVATGQELRTLKREGREVWSLGISPDGRQLAAGDQHGVVTLWDAATGQRLRAIQGHTGPVYSVAFSPDGQRLASGSVDKTVKVWDPRAEPESHTLKGHTDAVPSVAFSPDGKLLAGVGRPSFDKAKKVPVEGQAKVWDATTGQETLTFKGPIVRLAFSPDSQRLATGAEDGTVKVWEAATGRELLTLRGQTGFVSAVVFSPDGQWLASGSRTGIGKVWDVTTQQEVLTLRWPDGALLGVAYSPDGRRLAGAGEGFLVRVWDASTGREVFTLRGHEAYTNHVAFSPDSRQLASSSYDGTVRIWDMSTGEAIHVLKGHVAPVVGVAYSPDGKRLASGSYDNTMRLWDVLTGQELLTFKGHTKVVLSVAFSPDGRHLASGSLDTTVKLWDAPPLPAPPGR